MKTLLLISLLISLSFATDSFEDLIKPIPGTKYIESQTMGSQDYQRFEDLTPTSDIDIQDGGYFKNCKYENADLNPLRSDTG